MGLNDTPSGERIHIGFFGRRNAGKSSLINAVTGQELSLVSDVAGTTTDPVYKAMELLPLGPVMLIDTAGFDDEGELGRLRVSKTRQALNKTDIAVLAVPASDKIDGKGDPNPTDSELISLFREKNIPYVIAYTKSDLTNGGAPLSDNEIAVSAATGEGINELREKLAHMVPNEDSAPIIGDLVKPGELVVLVVPVDSAAPKGRLILPQQQTIRDLLDHDAMSLVVKETGLCEALGKLASPPAMVVTDSQAFGEVAKDTPSDVALTSFSILMARHKGFLETAVKGAAALKKLRDGDRVLISEGCTHHRQCADIGTVKLPRWLREYTGASLEFDTSSGGGFPDDLSGYSLILHCGGCMLPEREIRYRMKCALDQGVPFTNYGVAIAQMKGILKRSLTVFPDLAKLV